MKRNETTTEQRALVAMRLASAVDYLISVARRSGLPDIAARLEDVQQELGPLLQRLERNSNSSQKR